VFGASPVAAMVYEGDFVAGVIGDQTDAAVGEDALFFPFPTIDGSAPSVVGGGDVAVGFTDDEATQALLCYLATAEAAEVWAAEGGFASPNQNVDTSVYPDEVSQQLAEQLTSAEVFRFDLSDSVPSEFGGTVGQGLFKLFQDYLADPSSFADIQQQMEDAAAAAYA
jgi:alpha-glucoside transport system substrate-binding protein